MKNFRTRWIFRSVNAGWLCTISWCAESVGFLFLDCLDYFNFIRLLVFPYYLCWWDGLGSLPLSSVIFTCFNDIKVTRNTRICGVIHHFALEFLALDASVMELYNETKKQYDLRNWLSGKETHFIVVTNRSS